MRRYFFIAVIFAVLCFWLTRPSPYARHFDTPLPSTAKLDEYAVIGMGFDVFYAFRFSFTDDQLRDQVIQEWNLQDSNNPVVEVTSFALLKPPEWWPVESLQGLKERYGLRIDSEERFWSVWIDRKNNYLYAEYGKW